MAALNSMYHTARGIVNRLVDPLRADEQIENFTLSVPEAQTTTVDSVQGRQMRPPAVLECSNCGTDVTQHKPTDAADCPGCYRKFDQTASDELELVRMHCPRCDSTMKYGRRHPRVFDRPEWASCPDCQYHWDIDHWF